MKILQFILNIVLGFILIFNLFLNQCEQEAYSSRVLDNPKQQTSMFFQLPETINAMTENSYVYPAYKYCFDSA